MLALLLETGVWFVIIAWGAGTWPRAAPQTEFELLVAKLPVLHLACQSEQLKKSQEDGVHNDRSSACVVYGGVLIGIGNQLRMGSSSPSDLAQAAVIFHQACVVAGGNDRKDACKSAADLWLKSTVNPGLACLAAFDCFQAHGPQWADAAVKDQVVSFWRTCVEPQSHKIGSAKAGRFLAGTGVQVGGPQLISMPKFSRGMPSLEQQAREAYKRLIKLKLGESGFSP